jgi:hypothetical protein
MGWTIGVLGFDSRQGLGIFLFTTVSRKALGPTQPPIQWVPGALSRGVKLTTHLHLVPRSRMRGAIPPLPLYVFMAWYLVKHRDSFTFISFNMLQLYNCNPPNDLRCILSQITPTLESRVRIPLATWMFVRTVYVLCYIAMPRPRPRSPVHLQSNRSGS